MTQKTTLRHASLTLAAGALSLAASAANADQVIIDDLIVQGSICAGFDCVNGESFGFDTLKLKENNLRIKAQDTSTSASFPTNDWQITFNDSSNGGANKFAIDDIDGGRTPFTIEAGAPSHSLYVEDGGRLGLGTSTPVTDIHVKSGNTPTLRLEQDGTSGFTPQTWDMAGNEANFFIRDATNGSDLPFRIFPNAGSNALAIEGGTGDIGMGTTAPDEDLHISSGETRVALQLESSASPDDLQIIWNGTDTRISNENSGVVEMIITPGGHVTMGGSVGVTGVATAPAAVTGTARMYVDSADSNKLKVIMGNGNIVTLATQ